MRSILITNTSVTELCLNVFSKEKLIDNRTYFKRCLIYVHQNPVKHGFVERLSDYRYTSFITILSEKATLLKRKKVLSMFESLTDFHLAHAELINLDATLD